MSSWQRAGRRLRYVRQRATYWWLFVRAGCWRRVMLRTTVIAITGSAGKSTTAMCLAHVLSAHAPTHTTQRNDNGLHGVLRTVLRMRPHHRFSVIEVGTDQPGQIRRQARLLKPDIAVVLNVGRAHMSAFKTLDAIASEKGCLVEALSPRGRAVLNGDDERVREMTSRARGAVSFFGSRPDNDVIMEDVRAALPERMTLTLRQGGHREVVRTRLVGAHWAPAVAAAVATAGLCGVRLRAAATALQEIVPFDARLQPLELPNGAIVVRDEGVGSPESMSGMLEVMRATRGRRRILVAGDVTASTQSSRQRFRWLGRQAAAVAEVAIFVGDHTHHAVQAAIAEGMEPARCHDVTDVVAAADLLRRELRGGDVVFVKSRSDQHLTRLVLAQFGGIGCWKNACAIRGVCDWCPRLRPEFDLATTLDAAARAAHATLLEETRRLDAEHSA